MAQTNLFEKSEASLAGLNNPGQININVPLLTDNRL
jgi:hypothetical protein